MRYAAVVAASAALVGTLVSARDGRSETAPAVRAAAQTVSAAEAPQRSTVTRRTAQRGQEDFRWAGRVARGQQIEIRGIVGDVRAEVASGDQVEVVGRRSGDNADRVRIEVVEGDDGVTICAIYPQRRREGRPDGDRGGRGGSRDWCGGDDTNEGEIDAEEARIDFTVRVPAGVKFAAQVVAGDVYATSLRSPVDVATVSGNVEVSTTGTARAASVSGNVNATFGQTDGEEMEFATVSGDVVLRMAGNVGAEVSAQTLSGEIESDFDLRMGSMSGDDEENEDEDDEGGFHVNLDIGRQAKGTIGRGGPELSVTTVSGDIRLERAQ
ncbi:MAG TPA: DUF4097 family beta strand repeat-containing protein [Longimicrobium sp.]|jgi:hypothetical protein|uniref:DUF4097 family beta strand repeat-containing protein n=1 Tax=Longimicrobium sp. TaxID=2029185 RepID=UPI002ED99839